MNSDFSGSIESEVGELRARIGRIEAALRQRGVVLEEAELRSAPQPANANPPQSPYLHAAAPVQQTERRAPEAAQAASAQPPVTRPMFAAMGAANAQDDHSLESRIGSQWFNRIGILAVLIGMAWFLKLAIDNHWIGPLGRVLIGLVAGAGLIAWSERFRSRGYAAFSYSLKAIGSGTLYLSLWAAFSLYHLLPSGAAFAAMIAVTAFNGFMAWAQDAELLALYAIVGGLSTPLLISTGENHEVALFSYLLLLDLTVLILVVLRPWSRLLVGAFTGTALLFVGLGIGVLHRSPIRPHIVLPGLLLPHLCLRPAAGACARRGPGGHSWMGCTGAAASARGECDARLHRILWIVRQGRHAMGRSLAGRGVCRVLPAAAAFAGAGKAHDGSCGAGVSAPGCGGGVPHHCHPVEGP